MKAIKIKSGGQAFILESGETCPAGEICFFPGEWELAQRLSRAAATDPDSLKNFWKDLLENKRNVPGYTLLTKLNERPPAPKQEKLDLEGLGIRPRTQESHDDKSLGLAICKQILADFQRRGVKGTNAK